MFYFIFYVYLVTLVAQTAANLGKNDADEGPLKSYRHEIKRLSQENAKILQDMKTMGDENAKLFQDMKIMREEVKKLQRLLKMNNITTFQIRPSKKGWIT